MANIKLQLAGLTCGTCERNVTNVLKANNHVLNVLHVDLTTAEIEVDNNSTQVLNSIIEDITDIGYEAVIM